MGVLKQRKGCESSKEWCCGFVVEWESDKSDVAIRISHALKFCSQLMRVAVHCFLALLCVRQHTSRSLLFVLHVAASRMYQACKTHNLTPWLLCRYLAATTGKASIASVVIPSAISPSAASTSTSLSELHSRMVRPCFTHRSTIREASGGAA